jgi:hypothetical protein
LYFIEAEEGRAMVREYLLTSTGMGIVAILGLAGGCLSYLAYRPFADHLPGKVLFGLAMPALIGLVGTASAGEGPAMIPVRFITWAVPITLITIVLHYIDRVWIAGSMKR